MKELSIEEKATRYDEAIKKAGERYNEEYTSTLERSTLAYVFPELKESEDERIRKSLIDMLKNDEKCYLKEIAWLEKQGEEEYALKSSKDEDVRKFRQYIEKQAKAYEFNLPNRGYDIYAFAKDLLIWLEKQGEQQKEYNICDTCDYNGSCINPCPAKLTGKQGEQKPTDKVELKFKVGDVVRSSNGTMLKIVGITDYCYNCVICATNDEYSFGFNIQDEFELVEQKPADKVEPKFHKGEWIINTITKEIEQIIELTGYEYICSGHLIVSFNNQHLFKKWDISDAKDGDVLAEHETIVLFKKIEGLNIKCYCTYHYLGFNPTFYVDTLQNKIPYRPATKEQCDTLMKAMADAGYIFDFEKKELKKIEQIPDWCEEDEANIMVIIEALQYCAKDNAYKKEIDWLKFLKYRMQLPKKEWNEEDDKYRLYLIEYLEGETKSETLKGRAIDWLKSIRPQSHWKLNEEQIKEELNKAANEWERKASFSPIAMVMDGDRPIGTKQHITSHADSFKAGVDWIIKKLKG